MALGEMRGVNPPAADASQDRPEETHCKRRQPEHGSQTALDERCRHDQRPAEERRASHPQHSCQQIRLGPPCNRKQPDEHDLHDEKRQSEDEAMSAEGFRDCERGDKQRRGCDKHHRQHDPVVRVDRVRQPGIARPRPPQNRHNEQAATEPTPRRIIHQQGRHLRKREHEHEVEEELGRRYPAIRLGVKLGHNPTLTQTRWRRETNLGVDGCRGAMGTAVAVWSCYSRPVVSLVIFLIAGGNLPVARSATVTCSRTARMLARRAIQTSRRGSASLA